jgi:hypothetical protein
MPDVGPVFRPAAGAGSKRTRPTYRGAAPRFWRAATGLFSTPRDAALFSMRAGRPANAGATVLPAGGMRASRTPRSASFSPKSRPADGPASRRHASPSRGQSRSPVSSKRRRACPPGYGVFLRERTRPPACWATSRRACPCGHVPTFLFQASFCSIGTNQVFRGCSADAKTAEPELRQYVGPVFRPGDSVFRPAAAAGSKRTRPTYPGAVE